MLRLDLLYDQARSSGAETVSVGACEVVVAVGQIRSLCNSPEPGGVIDCGEVFEPDAKDDLGDLASELVTDDAYPLDDQWQVIAEKLNGETPGEPTSGAGENLLQQIREARADKEFKDLICCAVLVKKERVGPVNWYGERGPRVLGAALADPQWPPVSAVHDGRASRSVTRREVEPLLGYAAGSLKAVMQQQQGRCWLAPVACRV
ncbi:hypothetical protein [Streptomyces melanogenes]|uniref:hypothetical protein n=1 Tax=Streptomyces melanogenes TaxID=67326 RepID=UPI003793A587